MGSKLKLRKRRRRTMKGGQNQSAQVKPVQEDIQAAIAQKQQELEQAEVALQQSKSAVEVKKKELKEVQSKQPGSCSVM